MELLAKDGVVKVEVSSALNFNIADGSLEALKWLALLSMTVDHANQFYAPIFYSHYCIGRLAMPLFAFVLAYNLAREKVDGFRGYKRILKRLIWFGLLATPAYITMKGGYQWFPLNIMFTLFAAVWMVFLYEKSGWLNIIGCAALLLVAGIFVDYSWYGLALCLASWYFCKSPSYLRLLVYCVFLYMLGQVNGNNWALAALPILFFATKIDIKIPRLPYFFYTYYPAHLSALFFIKTLLN